MRPMSSPHRSRPRTRMVLALDADRAVARSFCGPIFTALFFVIRNQLRYAKHADAASREVSSTPQTRLNISHSEIHSRPMLKRRAPAGRREVMGGLAKGLDVIRAFTREQPAM